MLNTPKKPCINPRCTLNNPKQAYLHGGGPGLLHNPGFGVPAFSAIGRTEYSVMQAQKITLRMYMNLFHCEDPNTSAVELFE